MFETFMSLFTRLVIAVEKLAGALIYQAPANPPVNQVQQNAAPAPPTPFSSAAAAAPAAPATVVLPAAALAADQAKRVAPSRDDVGKALINLANGKGRDAAVAVLTQFKAQQVKDLKESDYPAVLDAINKAAA